MHCLRHTCFLPLLLILLLAYNSSRGQLRAQRTFSYGAKNYNTQRIIQIAQGGYIVLTNYSNSWALDTIFAPLSNSLNILKLTSNFDTVWSKQIANFTMADATGLKDGTIAIIGTPFLRATVSSPIDFAVIKMDTAGAIVRQQSFYQQTSGSSSSNYYSTPWANIVELTNGQLFILSYHLHPDLFTPLRRHFMRLSPNLELLSGKELSSPVQDVAEYGDKYLFFGQLAVQVIDTNRISITNYNPVYYNFSTPYAAQIIEVDTNMNMLLHKRIVDSNRLISNLFWNSAANQYFARFMKFTDYDTYASYANLNFSNNQNSFRTVNIRNLFKASTIQGGVSNRTFFLNNSCYTISSTDAFWSYYADNTINTIVDSTSNNFRFRIVKVNGDLSVNWYQRLHQFGFSFPFNTFNPNFTPEYTPNLSNLTLQLQGSDLILFGTKLPTRISNAPTSIPVSVTKRETGIFVTRLDSSGVAANCNITAEKYEVADDSIQFRDLPFYNFTSQSYSESPTTYTIVPMSLASIADTCLPLQQPVSKFIFVSSSSTGFSDSIVCRETPVYVREFSYNEPKDWYWIFPPEADLSGADSTNFPDLGNIKFNTVGRFPVKLVTSNAAGGDTLTQYITVINFIPQPNLGNDTTLCTGDSLVLIYRDPPDSRHYFLGNNINTESDTLVIREAGEYVCAAYTSCGYKYDTIQVSFANRPLADFTDSIGCNNLSASFKDNSNFNGSPYLFYSWKFFNAANALIGVSTLQNPVFTFPQFDSFYVQLTVTSPTACSYRDSIRKTVYLKASPTASFTSSNTCGSLTANFTSTSSVAVDTIQTYQWQFGDGQTSSLQNPIINFTNYGNQTAQLTVTGSRGCVSDIVSQNVTIKDKPVAAISTLTDSVCSNTTFTLYGDAVVRGAAIDSLKWEFAGSAVGINPSITQNFSLAGLYRYALTATSDAGCTSDTVFKTITVVGKPTAAFTFSNACGSLSIPFTSTSSVSNDVIARHYWSFGDNSFSTQQNPVKTYTAFLDAYTVRYAATSSIGCSSDTVSQNVVVKDKPVATLTYSYNACDNQPFNVQANTLANNASITNQQWWINNAVQSSNTSSITITQPAGNYKLQYLATSSKACVSDTAILNITVDAVPVANFTTSNTCTGEPINLQNNSSGAGNIYKWYFGNGDSSTAITPVYRYTTAGNYSIRLVASSPNNCSTTFTQPIVIEPAPVAAFSITESCIGKPISIVNNSSNAVQYDWLSSDGQNAATTLPNFLYATAGNYNIQLTAISRNGCSDVATQNINLQPVQIFTTNDTSIFINQPLQLFAGGAASYSWQPATQLNNGNIANPTFTTINGGAYTLTVEGTTAQGCKGTKNITITAFSNAPGLLPNAFSPNGDANNPTFRFNCTGMRSLTYFRIYNRYGQIIYNQSGCNATGWNGTYNGTPQNPGAYVYVWQGVDFTGREVSGKGTVVLIR